MYRLLQNYFVEELFVIYPELNHVQLMEKIQNELSWSTKTNIKRYEATLGKDYTFSGNTHKAQPIPDLLKPLLNFINYELEADYNVIHCNYYRDGSVGLGRHTDNEPEHKGDTIVSLSLGASRNFIIGNETILLKGGDLLLFNRFTFHALPKQPEVSLPRLSLTFREFY